MKLKFGIDFKLDIKVTKSTSDCIYALSLYIARKVIGHWEFKSAPSASLRLAIGQLSYFFACFG